MDALVDAAGYVDVEMDLATGLRAAVDAVLPGAIGGLERPTPIRDARTGVALRD